MMRFASKISLNLKIGARCKHHRSFELLTNGKAIFLVDAALVKGAMYESPCTLMKI